MDSTGGTAPDLRGWRDSAATQIYRLEPPLWTLHALIFSNCSSREQQLQYSHSDFPRCRQSTSVVAVLMAFSCSCCL